MDVEALRSACARGEHPRYLFFWGHQERRGTPSYYLSQWYPAAFRVDGVDYASAEHWMMAEKARLFGDAETCARILVAPTPAHAKRLGAEVQGFDEERWCAERFEIVVRGNVHKFAQQPELGAFLRGTGEHVLVEASPVDRIWGIGYAATDPQASDPAQWRGLNLLGFALMEARARLLAAVSGAALTR